MTDTLFIAGAVIAVLVVVAMAWMVAFTTRRKGAAASAVRKGVEQIDTVQGWAPQATRVLSNVERKAFETLRTAFPAHIILAQVPLARFIKVPTRNSYAEWLRRAGQLCADLVVCDRYSQVIAVVELRRNGEVSNPRIGRRQQRLIRVLKAADIRVHEWAEHSLPTPEQARELIAPTPPESAGAQAVAMPPMVERPEPVRMEPRVNPLAEDDCDSTQDEIIEMREPPPGTWYDDLEAGEGPLERSRSGRQDLPKR